MAITDDMRRFSMNLAATLASEELAAALSCSNTEALAALLASDTGAALYDDQLKLWWESPKYIASAYLSERGIHNNL